jgi:hypothetical protein
MNRIAWCSLAWIASAASLYADEPREAVTRAAIERSLPLLQQGAKTFRERSPGRCIACHHQGLVLPTIALARQRGFRIDEALAREEIERVHGFYVRRQTRYAAALNDARAAAAADPFGNFNVHAGYWLWALAAEYVPGDEALATSAALLATRQWPDGRWSFTDTARAPLQSSDFTTTSLAAFALSQYAAKADRPRTEEHLARARQWLATTPPRTIDDHAFRLFGLAWSHAPADDITRAANELLPQQRSDGGWAQQANMPTDAYATGLALVALYQTGHLTGTSEASRLASDYLLSTQQSDGSWLVKTRAIPTNPYFESGFPHGRSQFISYAATCWATMALCLTSSPERADESPSRP